MSLSLGLSAWSVDAVAQQPPFPPGYTPLPAPAPVRSAPKVSSSLELGVLYGTAAAYGVGLGIWFDAELSLSDPGTALIPVVVLGAAGPLAVFALDHPPLPVGAPASTASGIALGAAEGALIATYQRSRSTDPVGLVGVTRAIALGSTLGAVGGYTLGVTQEPEPESSAFTVSAAFWGTAVGGMFGFGASRAEGGFSEADDDLALGALVGMNVGLVSAAALGTVTIPDWYQLKWMWYGGVLGAAVGAPVFLFYTRQDAPPAKRGFLFMGTTTTLGSALGFVLAADRGSRSRGQSEPPGVLSVDALGPTWLPGVGPGLGVSGTLY